jgi:HPt (histidine-containing phosphotransfer) domain-containing protein
MWDKLSRADLETARQELKKRRELTLRRHLEELRELDAAEAELQTLDQLIGAFVEKFGSKIAPMTTGLGVEDKNVNAAEGHAIAGVSLLITQAQKSKLRELGLGDDEIRNMRPDDAHRILGVAS